MDSTDSSLPRVLCFQVVCSICQTEQARDLERTISLESLELVGVTISFIAKTVELAMQRACAINTHALRTPQIKNSCPVCYEYLFDSVKVAHVMKCGHTMHMDCYQKMINKQQNRCPLCSKSTMDMSSSWQVLDEEISATEMPAELRVEVAMTATRGAMLCSTCWDKNARIVVHTTLAESQPRRTR